MLYFVRLVYFHSFVLTARQGPAANPLPKGAQRAVQTVHLEIVVAAGSKEGAGP